MTFGLKVYGVIVMVSGVRNLGFGSMGSHENRGYELGL